MQRTYFTRILSVLLISSGIAATFAGEVDATGKGFRFPGGDAEAGREAFIKLNCVQCHLVQNVKFPEVTTKRRIEVTLAAKLHFVKKYENIVTAITNPRHVVAEQYKALLTKPEQVGGIEPIMPDFTKSMKVRQLMDITAFLDEVYRREQKDYGE